MSLPALQLAGKWVQLSRSPVRDQSALVRAQNSELTSSALRWGLYSLGGLLIERESWCITIAESESSEEA